MEVVKALTTIVNADTVQKDNAVFKLHYRFTVTLLMVFSVLVTTKQYFGDPIKCDLGDDSKHLQGTAETFCWIYGTYTVGAGSDNARVPGLGNEVGREQTWHLYYQWVAVVLLIQAFFFYIPCYLWNVWEGGRLEKLVKDLVTAEIKMAVFTAVLLSMTSLLWVKIHQGVTDCSFLCEIMID